MNGKDKCKILKQIRRDIAKNNDIMLTVAECTHKGNCAGTCPRCEAEVAALEKALAERRRQGKRVFLAGISAGIVTAGCVSCGPIETLENKFFGVESLSGDIAVETTAEETTVKEDEFDKNFMGLMDPKTVDGEISPDNTDKISDIDESLDSLETVSAAADTEIPSGNQVE